MVSAITIKKYLDRCDNVLFASSEDEARELINEILSVFRTDFSGLDYGLRTYTSPFGDSRADYLSSLKVIKARLEKEYDAIKPDQSKNEDSVKNHKILISHATKDKNYVGKIINLLEALGLREDEIICSSIPPYSIPLDNNIYAWLVKEFQTSDLHVIYVLSKSYYSSVACLNEMGAAWAMKQKGTTILLPGFDYGEVKGCIDSLRIGIKLDDDIDIVRYRLSELKDNLVYEFGLSSMSESYWEKKRNEFLDSINELMHQDNQEDDEENNIDQNIIQLYAEIREEAARVLFRYGKAYSNIVENPDDLHEEASKGLFEFAEKIKGFITKLSQEIPGIPSKFEMEELCGLFTGLSHTMYSYNGQDPFRLLEDNDRRVETIKRILKI